MVDVGVPVVLPVRVDLIVARTLLIVNWVGRVPSTHITLNPGLDVPEVHAGLVTAAPLEVVGSRQVEIGAR